MRQHPLEARVPVGVRDVHLAARHAEQVPVCAAEAQRRNELAQIRAAQVPMHAMSSGSDRAAKPFTDRSGPDDGDGAGHGPADEDAPFQAGWFHYYFDDQRWEWSEQVQRLHGYQPGTVMPTTELVLSHKHPDDRDRVSATIDDITRTRRALSSRHRIVDTSGAVHWVMVVGDQFVDDTGAVIGTHGCYVDVTPDEHRNQERITERVTEIAAKRAVIDHVKGMLMLIYDIDEDAALGLLKWLSQENNVKVRLLAQQLSVDLRSHARSTTVDQAGFDRVLMTAHHRVRSA